jgi:tetratricopeptide (TPR) repeat protein
MSRAEQLRHPSEGLEEALAWNQLAEQCLEPNDRPALMARQRNELNGLLSKKDKNPVAGINDRSDATLDLYFDGLDLAMQKKFPEALRRLIPFTEKRPSHFMGWYVRGICHDGMAQHPDAIAAFDVCVALKPQFAWSHFARGLARLHGQRYDVAAEDFSEALKLHPKWRSALIDRALAFEGRARLEEAENDLTEALKQPDVPTRVYLLRSRIRKAKGDLVNAEIDRQTGMAAEPTDALSWNARGIWNLESNPEQALHDFDQALKSDPDMFDAMKNKAYVLADKLRRPNDAVVVLDELLKIYPDCVEARAGRGVYLARLGEIDRARADARECLKHDRSPFLLYQLAGLYAQLIRVDKQGGSKEKALEMIAGAFRGGFNQFAVVNSDPDLNPLRSDPEFKTILEHARGQARPNSR